MSKSVPSGTLNAIDAAAFVVVFDRQFSEEESKKLFTLEKTLKTDLPSFSQVEIQSPKKINGVMLRDFERSGKVPWALNVIDNQIVVSCSDYDRWERVWEKTDKFISKTIKLLNLKTLAVQACVLQYIDRFIGDAADYNISDIFDKSTPYLTEQALKSGNLWHVHQGWFNEDSKTERTLNVLNLASSEDKGKIITTIDHAAHMQYTKHKNATAFFNKKEYVKVFLDLHKNNKTIVGSLLNEKQKKAIKLNG